jgi:ribosomal protein L44E
MKLKPFHESIVTIIRNCDEDGLVTIEHLINMTKIPENHDAIVRALRYRRRLDGLKGDVPDGVIAGVIKQSKNKKLVSKCPNCGSSKTEIVNNKIMCWNCGRDYPIS